MRSTSFLPTIPFTSAYARGVAGANETRLMRVPADCPGLVHVSDSHQRRARSRGTMHPPNPLTRVLCPATSGHYRVAVLASRIRSNTA